MSTILKALRRLEQEKSAASDRPLSETLANAPLPPPPPAKRWRLWLLVSGVGVAAAAAAAFFLLSGEPGEPLPDTSQLAAAEVAAPQRPSPPTRVSPSRERPPQPPQPATEGTPTPSASVPMAPSDLGDGAPTSPPQRQPGLFPPSTTPLRELSPGALSSEVEVVRRVQPDPPLPPGTVPPQSPLYHKPPSDRAVSERPSPGSLRPGVSQKRRPARPATGSPVVAASPERPEAAVEESPRPADSEPPSAPEAARESAPEPIRVASVPPEKPAEPRPKQVSRSPVPDLTVERTVWHPLADRRIAVVALGDTGESVELREGDAVGPLVVSEIEPTGVVFLHDGVELRRRIGSR